MQRRTFWGGGLAAALTGEDRKARVALISDETGDHLPAYKRVELCQGMEDLLAVGFDADKLRKFKPDLAVISIEPLRMPEAALAAIDCGAHVVLEKPGCTKLSQMEQVAAAANRQGKQVMLAMASRLYPAAERARELIKAGAIGRPLGVDMHWVADQTRLRNPEYHRTWKASKERGGGGKLIFHGIHYLDLIRYLTGDRVAQVSAFTRNVGGQPIEVEDAAVVSMVFASGMVGTLNTGYYIDRGYDNRIALWGPEGWLHFEPHSTTPLSWHSKAGDDRMSQPKPAAVYDLMLQAAVDFARGVRGPFMTTEETLGVLEVVFGAYESARTGLAQRV